MNQKQIKIIFLIIFILNNAFCDAQEDYKGKLEWNESVDTHNIKYIPNVSYLGQGYNIFSANPHSTQGLDPGYKNIQALNLTYNDNLWTNVNPDRSYFIPDGASLTVQKSCTMSFTAREVSSLKEYQQSLEASVSIKGSYFGGRFRASVDYNEVESGMSSSEMQYIVSKATCSVFQLGFIDSPNLHPLLSNGAAIELKKLAAFKDNTDDKEANAYFDFFDQFGTHVVTSVKLGSLFGYRFQMKKSDVQSMKNQGINVSTSASYFNVRGRANTQIEQNNSNSFSSAVQSWTSYSIGATPNENNDPAQWATQTLDKPMPISSQITPYHEVLSTFTQRDSKGFSQADITKLIYKLRMYSNNYCSKRLLPNGRIKYCQQSNTSDFNQQQYDKIITYNGSAFQDISKTQVAKAYNNQTNFATQLILRPNESDYKPIPFLFLRNLNIVNGNILGQYIMISVEGGNNQCLTGQPTIGEYATIESCNKGDRNLFSFVAYDDNVFSLRFKSNNNLVLGFDEQGFMRTMKADDCFECQVFQIKPARAK